eukprot:CAMPEP_0116913446 /NCGR_PEP_ID=MMETSP0467-20121206/16708_1 /TAXON_ID=283647 /ORGANISM="Mesodinium pulex, Strain SPMC105" /LENGTH=135 /DNA_ID=CAMNT_0004589661 /DNA_START=473 /DNA_END=876 /DNA_ORIENTATION=-
MIWKPLVVWEAFAGVEVLDVVPAPVFEDAEDSQHARVGGNEELDQFPLLALEFVVLAVDDVDVHAVLLVSNLQHGNASRMHLAHNTLAFVFRGERDNAVHQRFQVLVGHHVTVRVIVLSPVPNAAVQLALQVKVH